MRRSSNFRVENAAFFLATFLNAQVSKAFLKETFEKRTTDKKVEYFCCFCRALKCNREQSALKKSAASAAKSRPSSAQQRFVKSSQKRDMRLLYNKTIYATKVSVWCVWIPSFYRWDSNRETAQWSEKCEFIKFKTTVLSPKWFKKGLLEKVIRRPRGPKRVLKCPKSPNKVLKGF